MPLRFRNGARFIFVAGLAVLATALLALHETLIQTLTVLGKGPAPAGNGFRGWPSVVLAMLAAIVGRGIRSGAFAFHNRSRPCCRFEISRSRWVGGPWSRARRSTCAPATRWAWSAGTGPGRPAC